jgi:CheY-like chemotaxis protein
VLTPSILVIDDVADIVTEMVTMFALVDLPAVGADSIEGALNRLRQDSAIRVIICDLQLRSEDGRALPARLRAEPALAGRPFDIMFMTGEGDRDASPTAIAGATILRKPIDPDRLIRHAQRSLGVMRG